MQRGSFVKDGVVFKFQGEIFFSDSEFVGVTDVSLGSIESTITALRHWFTVMASEDKCNGGKKRASTHQGERPSNGRTGTSGSGDRTLSDATRGTGWTGKTEKTRPG
jgi:hypothetical protein